MGPTWSTPSGSIKWFWIGWSRGVWPPMGKSQSRRLMNRRGAGQFLKDPLQGGKKPHDVQWLVHDSRGDAIGLVVRGQVVFVVMLG